MGRLIRTALRRGLAGVRHVNPVAPSAATGLVAEVYDQLERDFGLLAPPVALHSPAPLPLAASWALLRETLVADGRADRAAKEAVAVAVSHANACPYCVQVHAATLHDLTAAPPVPALAAWVTGSVEERPFPPEWEADLLGVVVAFHYFNRMVNVFLDDSPMPAVSASFGDRLLGRFTGVPARAPHQPGASLHLLAPAALPPDLRWAEGNPAVADALARVAAALALPEVPAAVRGVVRRQLEVWDGAPRGLSGAWVEEAVADVPAADRDTARLALLTAFASHRVDDTVVAALAGDDRELVELTSWASFAAARRVAVLLHA
jgi:AhpD family alkylhydroperoxidase